MYNCELGYILIQPLYILYVILLCYHAYDITTNIEDQRVSLPSCEHFPMPINLGHEVNCVAIGWDILFALIEKTYTGIFHSYLISHKFP